MKKLLEHRRAVLRALSASLLIVAWTVPAWAQSNVAVINFQNALLDTADMQKQSMELEAKYKPRQEELQNLSQELEEIQRKLQSATGTELATLQADGQRKQRTAQRMSEDLQSDVEFDRQNILNEASVRMRDVINALRVEKEIDVIIDGGSVLAASALIDLTAEATRAYDAKHPANPAN